MDYEWLLAQIFRIYFDQIAVESIERSYEEIKEGLKECISGIYSILQDNSKEEFSKAIINIGKSHYFSNFSEYEKKIIAEVIGEEIDSGVLKDLSD